MSTRTRQNRRVRPWVAPRQAIDEALVTAIPLFLNEGGSTNTPSLQQGLQAGTTNTNRVGADAALAGMKPKL